MADNEYLYRLGVDASDLDAAINATVSVVGELDAMLGTKMPRSTATFVSGLEKVRIAMNGVAVDSSKVSTSLNEQGAAFDKYIEKLREAQGAYKAFREDQVTGVASGRNTFDPATASTAQLQEIVATAEASKASVVSGAKAELAARKAAYEEEAAYHESMQNAITASANAQEKRRVADAEAQAKAIEAASAASAEARIAAEKRVTAELAAEQEAQLQRFKEMQAAFVREQQAYNQGNAARYGVATGDNLTVGTTQTRNTAARNSGFTARSQSIGAQGEYSDIASQQTLAAMRTYYAEQERQAQAVTTVGAATQKASTAQATLNTHTQAAVTALPRLRYALYDVSTTLGILGAGLTGVGALVAKVSTEYQADFASVARTSKNLNDSQLKNLKTDLVDLSTQIPVTFADITKIATLGNQLNIPTQSLSAFTKTVAEFAASSNLSVEDSATAFGRLGQILHTTDYQSIGDQIAYLGVRAVATEGDIVKVAQQIAVTTTSYGLGQQATLALATAYASLGIKAESARGTTNRMMADLQKAVVQGGTALAQLGDVTGLGQQGFKDLFNSDANAAMTKFLEGLKRYGADTKGVLAELGITAQRDITNIGLLAQNTDVLTAAQKNATQAGGALKAMYDKQNDTVAAGLQKAQNKFNALLSDIGTSAQGPINGLVNDLNGLLGFIDKIEKDPAASGGLAITAGIVALTGVMLVGAGVTAQYLASFLALQTLTEALGGDATSLGGIWSALSGKARAQKAATDAQAASVEKLAAAITLLEEAQVSQAAAGDAAMMTTGGYVQKVDEKGQKYQEFEQTSHAVESGVARSGLGVQDGMVVSSLTQEQALYNAELAQTQVNLAKLSGDTAALEVQEAALNAATDELALVMAQANAEFTAAARNALLESGSIDKLAAASARAAEAQDILSRAQAKAAISANELTVAEEKSSTANMTSGLNQGEKAAGGFSNALGKLGLAAGILGIVALVPSFIDGIKQMVDTMTGAQTEADKLTSSVLGLENAQANKASIDRIKSNVQYATGTAKYEDTQNVDNIQWRTASGTRLAYNMATTGSYTSGDRLGPHSLGTVNTQGGGAADEYKTLDTALSDLVNKGQLKAAADGFKILTDGLNASDKSGKVLNTLLPTLAGALKVTGNQSIGAALAGKQASNASDKQAQSYATLVKAAFAGSSATSALQDSMGALGKSFAKDGVQAAIGGGALEKVVNSILAQAGGGPAAAAQMQALFNALVKGGFASTQQLLPLSNLISAIMHGQKVDPSAVDGITQLYQGYNSVADSANKAAAATEKVQRTLKDYGNDLDSTISSMLSYQFGVGDASDKITAGWNQIKDDAASARDSVKSIRADLMSLQATKATAQFALMVDSEYGDVTAAAQDRATLAKTTDDIAAKNKDLKKAQDDSSMSLTGNSAAAIKNRQALEGQITSVQGYVTALAESGASQKQIDAAIDKSKQQFIAHATQLGFNRTQVDKLATAFDGMKTIVNSIPRNITTGVTAKTSAAMKALADYRASITKTNGMKVDTPVGTTPKNIGDLGQEVGKLFLAGLDKEFHGHQAAFDFLYKTPSGHQQQAGSMILTPQAQALYGTPQFLSGGWTGSGGIYDPAGIVHGQEFVLNAVGAKLIPRPMLEAANQGRAPQSSSPTIVIGGSGNSGGFSAQDKMFLAQVLSAKPSISLSADQFGKAIDGANVRASMRGAG